MEIGKHLKTTPTDRGLRIITVSRPTPNGALHLGHIAGPYLRADVLARASRLKGWRTWTQCGYDSHQSYVRLGSLREGISPQDFVQRNARAITAGWSRLGIEFDHLWNPADREDAASLQSLSQGIVNRLAGRSATLRENITIPEIPGTPFDAYEAFISGECPHCGSPTSANGCEGCGVPARAGEILSPRSNHDEQRLVWHVRSVPVFHLGQQLPALQRHLDSCALLDWQKERLSSIVRSGPKLVPLCYRSDWGLAYGNPVAGGTVLHTPFESVAIAASPFFGTLNYRLRRSGSSPVEHIALHGIDNLFNGMVLTPAVLLAAGMPDAAPTRFLGNFFYTLEGSKFSTSRRHAVWATDAEAQYGADALRLFLAKTAPENTPTDFSHQAMQLFVRQILAGRWTARWNTVLERLPRLTEWALNSGQVTVTGPAAAEIFSRYYSALEPTGFSVQRAFSILDEFVESWPVELSDLPQVHALAHFAVAASPISPNLANAILLSLGCRLEAVRSRDSRVELEFNPRPVDAAPLRDITQHWQAAA